MTEFVLWSTHFAADQNKSKEMHGFNVYFVVIQGRNTNLKVEITQIDAKFDNDYEVRCDTFLLSVQKNYGTKIWVQNPNGI